MLQSFTNKCHKEKNTVAEINGGHSMYNTKNPTALQSQKWILEALLDLMKNKEYEKISVSDICRKAQLDRRTFYRNFNSKNEVLEQYIKKLSVEYMETFNKAKPKDKYTATLVFFDFWQRYIPFILNMQQCGLSNFVFLKFVNFVKSHEELLIDNQNTISHVDYIFAYRIGGYWNVMLTWASNNADLTPKELATILLQV